MLAAMTDSQQPWWRNAVVYQLYIRSFADGDGVGIGDIAGIRSRLLSSAPLSDDGRLPRDSAVWLG